MRKRKGYIKSCLNKWLQKSCGCLAREKSRESIKKLIKKKDPRPRDERLYSIWRNWRDFYSFQAWAFACGYAEGLTLDRVDVDGNYSPENCRWVTIKRQSRNKRKTIYLTLNGRKQPVADWADEMGVSWKALHSRYVRGWDDEKILLTPIKKILNGNPACELSSLGSYAGS